MSKIAFIYPGQGAQVAGMGADFYENNESAAKIYDKASEILGLDMKQLCFEENDKLDMTEYTQAALVTTCLAMTQVVIEKGLVPDITAGLSLGEYAALVASGAMSAEDAIRVVRERGKLMQGTVPAGEGAMSAVLAMEKEKIEEAIEFVSRFNFNEIASSRSATRPIPSGTSSNAVTSRTSAFLKFIFIPESSAMPSTS